MDILEPFRNILRRIIPYEFRGLIFQRRAVIERILAPPVIDFLMGIRFFFRGQETVNPWGRRWWAYPAQRMEAALDEILSHLESKWFNVIIDHGCGDGSHYSRMLKKYGRTIIGVDILDPSNVKYVDRYYQVSAELRGSYFDGIDSESVDVVIMLSNVGINIDKGSNDVGGKDWIDYFNDHSSRTGRYFTRENYPRILRRSGYLIIQEWERFPGKRLGKRTLQDVNEFIDVFYPHPDLEGFSLVIKGFSSQRIGPYIVYRKD